MKKLAKLVASAAMLGGLAVAAPMPAEAGVHVGIGVGVPVVGVGVGYHRDRHWCYYHPGACRGYRGPYYRAYRPGIAIGVPGIGVYVGGRGYWDGHRYWAHRYPYHGGWRYR